MPRRSRVVSLSLVMFFLQTVAAGELAPSPVDFTREVRPILSNHCFQCHGPDGATREADLRLDLHKSALADLGGYSAIAAGNPDESELIARVFSEDEDLQMPPVDSKLALTDEQKETLRRWVAEGATWADHWAFIPPTAPPTPQVAQTTWPRNPIDHFVLARMEKEGLSPSPEANKTRLLRRVTFDLTGLPPTLEAIDAFLADDSPDAYEQVVERLLETDAHAERLALDWMDLARYADSHGLHADGARRMWPWRDWVLSAFKANMPYDQFVTWQLAGDLLPDATHEQILATAFHRNHMATAEGGVIDEEARLNYVFDRTETTATAFLGLTMKCARCHDHKFDPIEQKEYYQLAAFFNNLRELGMTGDDGDFGPLLDLPEAEVQSKQIALNLQIAEAEAKLKQTREQAIKAWVAEGLPQDAVSIDALPEEHRYPLDSAAWEKVALPKKEKAKKKEKSSQEDSEEKPKPVQAKSELQLDGNASAIAAEMPEIVEGIDGKAMRISGEFGFLSLNKVGLFDTADPFTAALWVRPEPASEESEQGKVHTLLSAAGAKNQFWRGWEFRLEEEGHLGLQLVHNPPADYLHVRTSTTLPSQQWTHVAFVYDGSGKAAGVQLFVNGRQVETEPLADHLSRSILPVEHSLGFPQDPKRTVRVGKSYRSFTGENGIFHGSIDDIRMFPAALTPPEVAKLVDSYGILQDRATDSLTTDQHWQHRLMRLHADFQDAEENLRRLRTERVKLISAVPQIMVMQDMPKPRPMFIFQRGDYTQPTTQVEPATPTAALEFPTNVPQNRLGLARWLFQSENPLTARVTVNRYWQMMFGEGLVHTPHDFGIQGAPPTHPLLLDWLAVHFRESNWDVHDLLRHMVLSATYRQDSAVRPESHKKDPTNLLLSRAPSYRLPAEIIRDHALAVSGLLVHQLGGPSAKPYQPPGLWREKSNFSKELLEYKPDTGEGLYRRSLYTFIRRTSPPPAMGTLDAPNRSVCIVKREVTNTPLQALVLLNDPQFVEAARVLAERVQLEGGDSAESQIALTYRLVAGQQPKPPQMQILQEIFAKQLERFQQDLSAAEAILSVGEKQRDENLDPAHTAALTTVTNILMNFDEFYMKR